jgi:hypothetical protein
MSWWPSDREVSQFGLDDTTGIVDGLKGRFLNRVGDKRLLGETIVLSKLIREVA